MLRGRVPVSSVVREGCLHLAKRTSHAGVRSAVAGGALAPATLTPLTFAAAIATAWLVSLP